MVEWYPIADTVSGNAVSNRQYGSLLIGSDTQSSNRDQAGPAWRNNSDTTDGFAYRRYTRFEPRRFSAWSPRSFLDGA